MVTPPTAKSGSASGRTAYGSRPASRKAAMRNFGTSPRPRSMPKTASRSKPPYRIPTMRELKHVRFNGQRVVSLFSGCGGSSLGYRMAGYRVVWANEFIPAARDTYRANFPGTPVDERDIREIEAAHILARTGLQVGELDILDGSPPCASFSTAGKRHRHWGQIKSYSDTKQRTDDLFFEYIRLLDGLQPRRFIAENVAGLIKGVGKGVFLEILAGLKAAGYRVEARLLDAQWLGVPQARQLLFFVGVRRDLDGTPGFPEPLPYRSRKQNDALWWCEEGHRDSIAGRCDKCQARCRAGFARRAKGGFTKCYHPPGRLRV